MSSPNYPCPACGKETKVMHDPMTRICSLCRKVSYAKDCVPVAPQKKKDPSLDTVATQEEVLAGIETKVVPPLYPCPSCGRETKDAGGGWRCCRCAVRFCLGCAAEEISECVCDCGCDPNDDDAVHLLSCPRA